MNDRPFAYVCSPYSGDIETNTARAREYCRQVYEAGYTPLAPHLLFPQFLKEDNPEEREVGLEMGAALIPRCRVMLVCGDDVTEGMAREIRLARELRIETCALENIPAIHEVKAPANNDYYRAASYGDSLQPGQKLKIEHTIYIEQEKADIKELASLPLERLQKMRDGSAGMEAAVYQELLGTVDEWERHAGRTLLIDKAIEYLNTPVCQHSSNQWVGDDYGYQKISNMTYQMSWHVYEHTKYDRGVGASVPVSWDVTWDVRTNPKVGAKQTNGVKIAGQEKKRFTDKAAMEKYLQGRIAAYSHLFTELAPPVPSEYAKHFKINGLLLPGYTVAEDGTAQEGRAARGGKQSEGAERDKSSVLERIAADRVERAAATEKPPMDRPKSQDPEH